MTKLTENVFAVEVPEGADGFDFNIVNDHYELTYYTMEDDEEKELHGIPIPPGNWQILCATREAFDEEGKRKAEAKSQPMPFGFTYDYLRSLIASKGLDGSKNYCLIKKM